MRQLLPGHFLPNDDGDDGNATSRSPNLEMKIKRADSDSAGLAGFKSAAVGSLKELTHWTEQHALSSVDLWRLAQFV